MINYKYYYNKEKENSFNKSNVLCIYKQIKFEIELYECKLKLLNAKKEYLSVLIDKEKSVYNNLIINKTIIYLNQLRKSQEMLHDIIDKSIYSQLYKKEKEVFKELIINEKPPYDVKNELNIEYNELYKIGAKIYNLLNNINLDTKKA